VISKLRDCALKLKSSRAAAGCPAQTVLYAPAMPAPAIEKAIHRSSPRAAQEPIRVLTIIGSLRPGGAETYVANVSQAIREHGVDMEICALERTGPLLETVERAGIVVHDTPFPRHASILNALRMARTVGALRRIIARGRFDIVHTYLYSADILGVPAARLAGCKRVIISRRALHAWVHAPGKAHLHAIEQAVNCLATELIACSAAALEDARAHESHLPSRATVIYSGVDLDGFTPATPRSDGPLVLATVGALANRKGQEYAVRGLAAARSAGVDARLDLVGKGPDDAMLRRLVAELGLDRHVNFAGEQPDPRPYLRNADVFLLPSRQEGFSIALLEAMASSLPCIATDVGGNAEALVDGEGGRVVSPRDAGAIAGAIVELCRDRSRLRAMGAFNRARVERLFSIEASAKRLADWYRNGPDENRAAVLS
jgi:glycosyltransferase involved in cell wall biosynthesis